MERTCRTYRIWPTKAAHFILIGLAVWLAATPVTRAADVNASPLKKLHPWSNSSPGAWKMVRVISETFDEKGQVAKTGVSETKTTLCKIDDTGVTLEVETSIWVAGKLITSRPQQVKQGYHGQVNGHDSVKVTGLPVQKITVEGQTIPCQVTQVKLQRAKSDLVQIVTTFYNDTIEPYLFKREILLKQKADGKLVKQTTMTADSLQMPWAFENDQIRSASHFRTVTKTDKTIQTTLSYYSLDVPGGIVSQHVKEVDLQGRLVRRSIVELVGYSVQQKQASVKQTGWLVRRQSTRNKSKWWAKP